MGFTVGAGGSGALADGAVTAEKIADGAVSPEKLEGTGTPNDATFYRGDGAWETPAGVTAYDGSLGSNADVASITGLSGRKTYTFTARGVSNANSNRIFFTVNADTTETFTNGRQLVNATSYSPTTDTLLLASTISSGAAFEVRGTVSSVFDGTNTQVYLNCTGYAGGDAFRYMGHKQISGDVDLTSFSIRSNQANGLKSGFYLKAQEAP